MGYENGHKEIKIALTDIANFINAHKPVFSDRLDEMRQMWRQAWNCHDYVPLKNLVVILNSKAVFTGFNATLKKQKRLGVHGFSYIVVFETI